MVEQIENLSAEFQAISFAERGALDDREVEIVGGRTGKEVVPRVAYGAQGVDSKCRSIKERVDVFALGLAGSSSSRGAQRLMCI